MSKVAASNAAVMLLYERAPTPLLAVSVLIPVLVYAVFLLGIAYIIRSAWYALAPQRAESIERAWRFFQWGVLGASAIAWSVLTMIAVRMPAGPSNESAAVANLRTITTAEVTYASEHEGKYGEVSDLIADGLLDTRFSTSASGYVFTVTRSELDYTARAFPVSTRTGKYGFYTWPDAVIRYAEATTATCKPCYPKGRAGKPVR